MPTATATLRSYARQEMKNVDPNGKVWDDTAVTAALNNGYAKVQAAGTYAWPENQATGSVVFVGGVAEAALPADFVSLRTLRSSWNLSAGSKEDFFNVDPTQTGVPYAYYLEGANLGLFPTPASGGTVAILYNKVLPALTDSVGSALPVAFDIAIAKAAAYHILSGSPRFAVEAQNKLAEFNLEMNKLAFYRFRDRAASFNNAPVNGR